MERSLSCMIGFFFSSRRRHTRWPRDWSSDVCSSDLSEGENEADDGSPSWSPDGRRIAFTSTRDHEGDGFDSEELYVMGADGDRQTRLTENESGEGGPSW